MISVLNSRRGTRCCFPVRWQLQINAIDVELQPDHVHGVAGLKPMGDCDFLPAMIAGLLFRALVVCLSDLAAH
jgi:hypothetical protein